MPVEANFASGNSRILNQALLLTSSLMLLLKEELLFVLHFLLFRITSLLFFTDSRFYKFR